MMTRNHEGGLVFSEFVDDGTGEYLFTRSYYGYSVSDARRLYCTELAKIKA